MEEQERKTKSVELTIKVNKERLTNKLFAKLALSAVLCFIIAFNIGLLLTAVGLKLLLGYTLIHSFLDWLGCNLIGFGVKAMYNIILKKHSDPVPPQVQCTVKKFCEELSTNNPIEEENTEESGQEN